MTELGQNTSAYGSYNASDMNVAAKKLWKIPPAQFL